MRIDAPKSPLPPCVPGGRTPCPTCPQQDNCQHGLAVLYKEDRTVASAIKQAAQDAAKRKERSNHGPILRTIARVEPGEEVPG